MTTPDKPLTRTQLALQKSCPKCGAKPGDPCTYDRPSLLAPGPGSSSEHERVYRSKYVREQVMLMGTPCTRPHNERYNKVPNSFSARELKRRALHAQDRRDAEERRKVLMLRTEAERRETQKRQYAFDRWRMLVAFFAEHGEIFKETR